MAGKLKLSHLDYFRAVGQLQHVTKAAQQLGVSQPALSRAIANLEAELGIPLFEHRRRSVRLTENGEIFLRYVERAFEAIEDGLEDLRDRNEPGRGKIAIGFVRTLGYGFIPQLIRRFRVNYPGVQISLVQNNSAVLEEELKAGRLDLVFVTQINDKSGCNWDTLASQEIQLVVPISHRFANRHSVTLDELRDEPIVCFKKGHALRDLSDRVFRIAGIEPHISFECDDGSYLIGFVTAGLGVAMMPPNHGQVEGATAIKIDSTDARRDVVIAWPSNRYVNRSTLAFLDFARTSVGPEMSLD